MSKQPQNSSPSPHWPDKAKELCWDQLPSQDLIFQAIELDPKYMKLLPANLKLAIERAIATATAGATQPKNVSYGDDCIMLDDRKPADETDRYCDQVPFVPPLNWTRIVPK